MDDNNKNHLDSVLSFVAGKNQQADTSLREREASSWLLMATDLFPISTSSMGLSGNVFHDDSMDGHMMGWDATNPYEDSLLSNFSLNLPDSSGDTSEMANSAQLYHGDSADSIAFPVSTERNFQHSTPSDLPNNQYLSSSSTMGINPTFAPPTTSLRDSYNSLSNIPQRNTSNIKQASSSTSNRKRLAPKTIVEGTLASELDPEDQKRQKRLEKNREIAKNCRKRKREKKEALEEEIKRLREENNRMRIQLRDDTDDVSRSKQRDAVLHQLEICLQNNDREGIKKEMHQFLDDWSAFAKKRQTMAEFHLEQLKTLILPTQVTKMCMWSMQQGDDFFDEKLNELRYGGGIWNMISSVLQPTPEQRKAILDSRQGTVQQQENVAQLLDIVDEIQKRIENTMDSMREQLKGIVSVLTPEQHVQFLLFIRRILSEPRKKDSLFNILKERIQPNTDDQDTGTSPSDGESN